MTRIIKKSHVLVTGGAGLIGSNLIEVLLAQASGMKSFERFARSLRKGPKKVVAFIKHRITSGRIEEFNNQVARVVHSACGVRDLD
jgi:nucleoside-diphosphate-sugar epimerase